MSGCAGAGRGHSQTASPSWPMEIFHATEVMLSLGMGVGWGGRELSARFFSGFKCSAVQEFKLCWEFWEIWDFGVL